MFILKKARNYSNNRVLLIEDDPQMVAIVKTALREINPGTALECHDSIESAARVLEVDSAYALLIVDQNLKGPGTGLQLWEHCQRLGFKAPFVLLTGLSREEMFRALGRDKMAPAYLRKPVRPKELKEVIGTFVPGAVGGVAPLKAG